MSRFFYSTTISSTKSQLPNPAPGMPEDDKLPAAPQPIPTVMANGQFNEYLVAHQEFSPSTTFQGGAPYTRTLPHEDSGNAQ